MQAEAATEGFNAFPIIMPMLGVVLGGMLTFGIQSRFRYLDRKRLQQERLNRVHLFTAFMVPELLNVYQHVTEAVPENPQRPLWTYVLPLVGMNPAYLTYDLDSLSVLGGKRNSPILARLYLLALERNATVTTLHKYNERRSELIAALDPYTRFAADGTLQFADYRGVVAVRRIEVECEAMLTAIRADITNTRNNIYDLEPTYNAMMRELHGRKGEPNRLMLPPL